MPAIHLKNRTDGSFDLDSDSSGLASPGSQLTPELAAIGAATGPNPGGTAQIGALSDTASITA
jgi:hypothetical protein